MLECRFCDYYQSEAAQCGFTGHRLSQSNLRELTEYPCRSTSYAEYLGKKQDSEKILRRFSSENWRAVYLIPHRGYSRAGKRAL